MIYPRKLKKTILEHLNDDLTIVITGMRRVGKTFLARDLFDGLAFENKIFLDLEKPENLAIFKEESYDAIVRNLKSEKLFLKEKFPGDSLDLKNRAWIFLDEIQFYPQMPSIIKWLSDSFHLKFIVTGSSSFYLKNFFSESLSGRKAVFHLPPLDFGEFLLFRGLDYPRGASSLFDLTSLNTSASRLKYTSLFEEYLRVGGFPQAVLASNETSRREILLDILHSYLYLDVKALSDFRGIDELEKLLKILPPRVGQKIEVSKISQEIGVARLTAKNYLEFLRDTFVIDLISPFSRSPDQEIKAAQKLYFCDTAMGAILAIISEGQRLENFVHNSLSDRYSLNYYQRKSGAEIDFILDKKIAIEVKTFAEIRDYHRLQTLADDLGLKESYVLAERLAEDIHSPQIFPAFLLGFLER